MSATSPRRHTFAGTTAISGIGATEFSKDSGRSELRLATEAVASRPRRRRAHARRRRRPGDLRGRTPTPRSRWPARSAWGTSRSSAASTTAAGRRAPPCTRPPWPWPAAWPTWWSATAPSTSARGTVSAPGCKGAPPSANAENAHFSWYAPQGLLTPASWVAMFAQRYLHVTGATTEDFGRVAVADRAYAATNPAAWFYGKPITLEDHQASRWIVDPLRLLDCCQESDGGQAIVVTSLERARDLRQPPAVIDGRGAGLGRPAGHDDLLLPRRHDAPARDGRGGAPAVGDLGPRARRHAVRRALRPLHPVRALPARGARLLRVGRGQGVPPRRPHRARGQAAHQHPRRPARRGLHPRHERHRRRRAPGAGHGRQPGGGDSSTSSSPPAPAFPPAVWSSASTGAERRG